MPWDYLHSWGRCAFTRLIGLDPENFMICRAEVTTVAKKLCVWLNTLIFTPVLALVLLIYYVQATPALATTEETARRRPLTESSSPHSALRVQKLPRWREPSRARGGEPEAARPRGARPGKRGRPGRRCEEPGPRRGRSRQRDRPRCPPPARTAPGTHRRPPPNRSGKREAASARP